MFPKQDDDVYMPLEMLEASIILEEIPPADICTLGVDVARFGDDDTVIARNMNNKITLEKIRHGQDLMKTVGDVVVECRNIKEKFKYKKGLIWNACSLFIQNVLSMPIKWCYLRIKFRHKFIG